MYANGLALAVGYVKSMAMDYDGGIFPADGSGRGNLPSSTNFSGFQNYRDSFVKQDYNRLNLDQGELHEHHPLP